MPSEYKNRINALTSVTLNSMAEVCHDLLPQDYKDTPWLLPYGDKNFSKIFTDEDQLNGYTASYTVWHKGKLERIFRNVPIDTFEGEIAVVDWGCGQGLATIALKEYIANQNKRCSIKEAILIEPSALALDRAKFNLEHVIAGINIRTINKFINDVEPEEIRLSRPRKVIHLFSNILDLPGLSHKRISECIAVNISHDSYVLCVSPFYPWMSQRYQSFLRYFANPLDWSFSEQASDKAIHGYTFFSQSFRLLANVIGQIVKYDYFPETQFRVGYSLDCIAAIPKINLVKNTYFDAYAPFELGSAISDDINPIMAVLNNIISRGLPTKASPFLEDKMLEAFNMSERQELYGGISYPSILSDSQNEALKELAETNSLGNDSVLNQLLYTPIAVARFHKILIEAMACGRLDYNDDEWDILVVENDVPFAGLALDDFKGLFNNLTALSQEFYNVRLPKINLTIVNPNEEYFTSPIAAPYNHKLRPSQDEVNKDFDLVLNYSTEAKTEGAPNFSDYHAKNDCYFRLYGVADDMQYAERIVYTTDRINYKELCSKNQQGLFDNHIEEVEHLEYFLQLVFRKEKFRNGQIPILSRAIQNKSVIGLLPTGGGKSLTYQLAAILQPGVSIIIDPLVSLMKDQYDGLIKLGIDCCTFINSQVDTAVRSKREFGMEKSKYLFVFMSPERLCIHKFRQRLRNMQELNVYFAYGVIDETHCVSEWGHDFRFSYLHLGRNLYQYVLPKDGHVSLLGLTATASFDVLSDVERELSGEGAFPLDSDAIVRYENTNRLELQYHVVELDAEECYDKWAVYEKKNAVVASVLQEAQQHISELQRPENIELIKRRFIERENIRDERILQEIADADLTAEVDEDWASSETSNSSAIVFCPHRHGSLGVYDSDKKRGVSSAISAGLSTNKVGSFVGGDSLDEQEKFISGRTNIMVATKAFGMGTDKPNVRFTVNINHSGSLEGYVQEAGRAGRDRKMALSTILYCSKPFSEQNTLTRFLESVPVDYGVHKFFYENNFISPLFEKWIMFYLMSMNNSEYSDEENTSERTIRIETVRGFIEKLMSAKPGERLVYYLSCSYTNADIQEINQRLVANSLPRFMTEEELALTKLGKKVNYMYGFADYVEAIEKAIYRMCCVGVVEDFTRDYINDKFRIVTVRKNDGEYFETLKKFLTRYYSLDRAEEEINRARSFDGKNEIQKCLGFITDFVYSKIAVKRKRAMQDVEDFCFSAVNSDKGWIETNEDLKDFIYYYFNSKYAREDYMTENGLPYSLTVDTDHGRKSDFTIVFKYLKVIEEELLDAGGSQIENVKHLQGAVRLIRRSLTDTNPALDLLNCFCLFFLGTGNNLLLENELKSSFINGYKDFRERYKDNLNEFYSHIEQYKSLLGPAEYNILNEAQLKALNEWAALAEIQIHSDWLTNFENKYTK